MSIFRRNIRLPRLLTSSRTQAIGVIVVAHAWVAAALYLMGRGKSIGEEPLGLWAFCYGLPLPLTAWGIHRLSRLGDAPARRAWIDWFLLVASLLAAAYPAILMLFILAMAK